MLVLSAHISLPCHFVECIHVLSPLVDACAFRARWGGGAKPPPDQVFRDSLSRRRKGTAGLQMLDHGHLQAAVLADQP